MAQNKKDQFEKNFLDIAELCKAFSHPARIAIVKVLAQKNICICGEIVEILPLAQSTVSQHLKELKKIGLITGEIEGPKSCYCINWKRLNEFSGLLKNLIDTMHSMSQSCCQGGIHGKKK